MRKGREAKARLHNGATLWWWGFLLAAAAATAVFLTGFILWDVRPGTPLGISYGVAATVFLLAAALYGARRRAMGFVSRRGLGRARTWLYLHLYGGTLFLVLVLMHSGFRLPVGALNSGLWILSLWTALSGALGLVLQKWIPRVLASGLSTEVNYERIPELVDGIRGRAETLALESDDAVRALFTKKVAPELAAARRDPRYFVDPTGGIRSRLKGFHYLEGRLPAAERAKLAELEELYRTKLEIDAHYTLQQALRGWLYLHVPPSLVLLALVALHIFTVLYY